MNLKQMDYDMAPPYVPLTALLRNYLAAATYMGRRYTHNVTRTLPIFTIEGKTCVGQF
jgi:hypothetical protein